MDVLIMQQGCQELAQQMSLWSALQLESSAPTACEKPECGKTARWGSAHIHQADGIDTFESGEVAFNVQNAANEGFGHPELQTGTEQAYGADRESRPDGKDGKQDGG